LAVAVVALVVQLQELVILVVLVAVVVLVVVTLKQEALVQQVKVLRVAQGAVCLLL
jgi:hypothetical protein